MEPKISVIIPTLNEEKHLPYLLESIQKQNIPNIEIIVADAGSTDSTVEIAKRYKAKVVKGGLPAVGRNAGARVARGNIFVFLDADSLLSKNFLVDTLKQMQEQNLDLILLLQNHTNFPYENYGFFRDILRMVVASIANFSMKIMRFLDRYELVTGNLVVKKDVFTKLGGFREDLKFAEDYDFVKRAINNGFKVKFSRRTISVSSRRYKNLSFLYKVVPTIVLFGFVIQPLGRLLKKERWFKYWVNRIIAKAYGPLGGEGRNS